jgi:hypothetical protein
VQFSAATSGSSNDDDDDDDDNNNDNNKNNNSNYNNNNNRSQIECQQCKYQSNKYDHFLDLSLEVRLETCLLPVHKLKFCTLSIQKHPSLHEFVTFNSQIVSITILFHVCKREVELHLDLSLSLCLFYIYYLFISGSEVPLIGSGAEELHRLRNAFRR